MSCCNSNCNHDPCGSSFNQALTKAAQYAQYAQTQANKAEDLWLEFNALYLGAFAVAPTQDNQGNPLQVGALYWNTASNELYTWTGLAWYLAPGFDEFTPFLATGSITPVNLVNRFESIDKVKDFPTYQFLSTGSTTPRNLATRMADVVNVKDFGAVGDGVTDDTAAFVAAIATAKSVYVPKGIYEIGSNISITNPVYIYGDNPSSTVIERNYSPASDSQGVFAFSGSGTICGISNMTIRSKAGQTGGCLVSIVSGPSDNLGLYRFDWVDFTTTGTSTHQYTFYTDGTAKTSAPIGIRGLDFTGCSIFGGGISSLLVKGVLKFSFTGGGCYTAGGAAGSNVRISGSASVPTQSFAFFPSDCSCPISFDYATIGVFGCGVMGAVTNTTNTTNIYGFGYTGSLQENWIRSAFLDTQTGLRLTPQQGITNQGSSANFPVEMNGPITGFVSTGSVTAVGQTGVQYATNCPDTATFSFTNASSKLFSIDTGGGAAALVFADYKSSTITLVSNPSNEFQASSTPGAGFTGIYKSVNSHVINIKNNTGATVNYGILNLGIVSSTTDPA